MQWFYYSSPQIELGCMCPMSINEFDTLGLMVVLLYFFPGDPESK